MWKYQFKSLWFLKDKSDLQTWKKENNYLFNVYSKAFFQSAWLMIISRWQLRQIVSVTMLPRIVFIFSSSQKITLNFSQWGHCKVLSNMGLTSFTTWNVTILKIDWVKNEAIKAMFNDTTLWCVLKVYYLIIFIM